MSYIFLSCTKIIFITCLVLIAIFAVAILELRLEERNHQLFLATRELENLVLLDNLTKLPNRLYLVDYSKYLFTDSRLYNQKVAFLYIRPLAKVNEYSSN